eukprot:scaffold1171_cov103-Skeletonema_dohrnii-CCMP3373.AAC.4
MICRLCRANAASTARSSSQSNPDQTRPLVSVSIHNGMDSFVIVCGDVSREGRDMLGVDNAQDAVLGQGFADINVVAISWHTALLQKAGGGCDS